MHKRRLFSECVTPSGFMNLERHSDFTVKIARSHISFKYGLAFGKTFVSNNFAVG